MLNTSPQDKLYMRLQVFNACEHSCIMMIKSIKSNKKSPLLLPVYIISGQKYTTYQKKLNT